MASRDQKSIKGRSHASLTGLSEATKLPVPSGNAGDRDAFSLAKSKEGLWGLVLRALSASLSLGVGRGQELTRPGASLCM